MNESSEIYRDFFFEISTEMSTLKYSDIYGSAIAAGEIRERRYAGIKISYFGSA